MVSKVRHLIMVPAPVQRDWALQTAPQVCYQRRCRIIYALSNFSWFEPFDQCRRFICPYVPIFDTAFSQLSERSSFFKPFNIERTLEQALIGSVVGDADDRDRR